MSVLRELHFVFILFFFMSRPTPRVTHTYPIFPYTQLLLSSVALANERCAFYLLDTDQYLQGGFPARLPDTVKDGIREHGIRNSHLTSIAPTGSISLAFADNASNGIEPAFSWFYTRSKSMPDGSKKDYTVEDHALRDYQIGRASWSERVSKYV